MHIYSLYKNLFQSRPCTVRNDTSVTYMVQSFTAPRIKHYVTCVGVCLGQFSNSFLPMILYDFCLLPGYFCDKTAYIRNFNSLCTSRTHVRIEKLTVLWKTLFCRRCNSKLWSAANSQAGQTKLILFQMLQLNHFLWVVSRPQQALWRPGLLFFLYGFSMWSYCQRLYRDISHGLQRERPSFQCKIGLCQSKSAREMNCLILIAIDFSGPRVALRLNWRDTT